MQILRPAKERGPQDDMGLGFAWGKNGDLFPTCCSSPHSGQSYSNGFPAKFWVRYEQEKL
jgi:hypothetical protein